MSAPPESDDRRPTVEFELQVGAQTIQGKARLPEGEVRLADLLPVLRKFNDAVLGAAIEDERQAGREISCRAGCGACCRQIVPLNVHEATWLLEWIDQLPENQQAMIRARFKAALEALEEKGMLERTRQAHLIEGEPATVAFALDYLRSWVACPFLINESCAIHAVRPMKCREYLVTSPAIHCSHPTADSVAMVPVPKTFSKVLLHFDKPGVKSEWLPLVLLLEWGAVHRHDPRRRDNSVTLFREFIAGFAATTPEAQEEMLRPETAA